MTSAMRFAVLAAHPHLSPLLDTAEAWLGTPYVWGGASPGEGLDCSNFTWLLFRESGFAYDRFLGTAAMSRVAASNGLRRVEGLDAARPGDLLVYGYHDDPAARKGWHGHVVVLIDLTGGLTGHRGLVLGAHGGDVRRVAYVVAQGFDAGYFREPRLTLRAVLRPVEF